MATTDAASTTGTANVKRLDITLPFFIPVRFSAGPTPGSGTPRININESRISLSILASMGHHCDYAQPIGFNAFDYLFSRLIRRHVTVVHTLDCVAYPCSVTALVLCDAVT